MVVLKMAVYISVFYLQGTDFCAELSGQSYRIEVYNIIHLGKNI